MQHVKFLPWIGKNYKTGGIFGKRILVLGESHYCPKNEAVPEITNKVLRTHIYDSSSSTFTKFERSLVGHKTDTVDREKIWDSVAFYNFLQENMADARIAGTRSQYEDAAVPFFEVLEELRPEYVIVWGSRLWEYLPNDNYTSLNEVIYDGYKAGDGLYTLKDGTKIKVIAVYHPSTGYEWKWWYEYLKEWGI